MYSTPHMAWKVKDKLPMQKKKVPLWVFGKPQSHNSRSSSYHLRVFFILCKSLLCVRTRWDALRYRHVSPIYIYCCRLTCTNTHTHTYAPWRELRRYEKTGGREAREQQEEEKDFGHVSESEGKRNKRGWLNGVFKRVQSALWCLQIINHVMSNNHGR